MSFWNDLNNQISRIANPKNTGTPNPFGGLGSMNDTATSGYAPDGRNLGAPPSPAESPFARAPSEIESINQVSSTPFNVIDIKPYFVKVEDFPCIYPHQVLTDLIGPEQGFEADVNAGGTGAAGGAPTFDTSTNPFWRTVQLPLLGNFLKIEYMPTRISDLLAADPTGTRSKTELISSAVDASQSFYGGPPSTMHNNDDYWATDGAVGPPYKLVFPNASLLAELQAKSLILISFDSQQKIPLVATSGTVFKCPYNTVFITFKTGSPNLRVTSGYNTQIEAPSVDRNANANLAMGPGFGFLDKPLLHYEPFGITSGDNSGTDLQRTLLSATGENLILVDSLNTVITTSSAGYPSRNGVSLLWLTEFSFENDISNFNQTEQWVVTIYIADTSGTLRRIVRKWQFQDQFRPTSSLNGNGSTKISKYLTFPTPIRVSLHANERLYIRVYNGAATGTAYSYTIGGYTFGRWRFEPKNGSSAQVPIVLMDLLNEHPYFLDNQRTLAGIQSPDAVKI